MSLELILYYDDYNVIFWLRVVFTAVLSRYLIHFVYPKVWVGRRLFPVPLLIMCLCKTNTYTIEFVVVLWMNSNFMCRDHYRTYHQPWSPLGCLHFSCLVWTKEPVLEIHVDVPVTITWTFLWPFNSRRQFYKGTIKVFLVETSSVSFTRVNLVVHEGLSNQFS